MFLCPSAPLASRVAVSVTWVAMDTLKRGVEGLPARTQQSGAELCPGPQLPPPPNPAGSRGLVHTSGAQGYSSTCVTSISSPKVKLSQGGALPLPSL